MNDIVPHLPNELLEHDYHHIQREIWYHNDDSPLEYITCDDEGEDPNCSISEPGIGFLDHVYYLGMSTGCDNPDAYHLSILKKSLDGESVDYYNLFEKFVLNCD